MKRPQPDLGALTLQGYIGNVGSVRKLLRLWGTSTTPSGVEVLNHRRYVYPGSSRPDNFKKLFTYLGVYEDAIDADYRGVSSSWVYFNKNNGSVPPANLKGFVTGNLNGMWWDNSDGPIPNELTITTSIVIEAIIGEYAAGDSVPTTSLLSPNQPKEVLIAAITNNYDTLWDTCVITHHGAGLVYKGEIEVSGSAELGTLITRPDTYDLTPNDPWLSVYVRNALRSNGPTCTITDVSIGYAKNEDGDLYTTYVVDLEMPYNTVSEGSVFVEGIVRDITDTYDSKSHRKLSYPNGYYTKKAITGMSSQDLEDDPELVTRTYVLWEYESTTQESKFNSIWYEYDSVWYVKAEALRNPRNFGLTYRELSSYIWPLLDSDYRKKKAPWWKKVVAVVVFVVSLYFAIPTGGASINWTTVAAAILTASLTVTLFTLAAGLTGDAELAQALAEVNKAIEPLVIVATIVMLTHSLKTGFDKAANSASASLNKPVEELTIGEITTHYVKSSASSMADSIVKGATDFASGNISKESLAFTEKLADMVMTPEKNKLGTINDRNKDLKAEYEGIMKELVQEYDALRGFSQVYAKPATSDWSIYATIFDQPYERGGGPMALGNIQRTTKQALRKADYSDASFVGIVGL